MLNDKSKILGLTSNDEYTRKDKFINEVFGLAACKDKFLALFDEYVNKIMLCMMSLDNKTHSNARNHRVIAQCVNHSFNLNSCSNKWMVKGNLCLGTFAKCIIKLSEELTLDCQWGMIKSRNPTKLHWMPHNCRGILEKDLDILAEWKTMHQINPESNNTNSELIMQKVKN